MHKLLIVFSILCYLLLNVGYNNGINAEDVPSTSNVTTAKTIGETLADLLPADMIEEQPTVLVALLVRNKAHVLPLFLTYFELLNYPKDRIALWIRSDHNSDASIEVLQLWLNHTSELYHSVDIEFDKTQKNYENETGPFDWPTERFNHLINLKESALKYGKQIWADFIFFLDADVLLTEEDTLSYLVKQRLPVVAPMLLSESLYSNYWCGMSEDYYYQRTDEYKDIYHTRKIGTFPVRMIHTAVLINLRHMASRYLTFDRKQLIKQQVINSDWTKQKSHLCHLYDGPLDDIIVFAISANCSQIPLFVNNELPFGYVVQPVDRIDSPELDLQQLVNLRVNIVNDWGFIPEHIDYLNSFYSFPQKSNLTLDRIFFINLERREERRDKMEKLSLELGLDLEYFNAVDGKKLSTEVLKEMDIKLLPEYEDPYNHRKMTMGEVGCFLSHYHIWEKMVKENLTEVLILEDDIRFELNFRERALKVLQEARKTVEYDLIYFGRKRLKNESEPFVNDANNLVHVGYSYWTLGYVITLNGARKLLAAKPLEKLLPVDEFLPIMFNKHPNSTWTDAFPTRDLLAFSSAPLLLYPTHYTGEVGYISDTEDSELTSEILFNAKHSSSDAQLKSNRQLDFSTPEANNGKKSLNVEDEIDIELPKPDISDFAQADLGKGREDL